MSQRIDLVSSMYGAFARGDLAAVLAGLAPDVEWVTPPTLPWSTGRYAGHAGVLAYFESFLAALDDARVEPDELRDTGAGVVALGHERGRVRGTGRPFTARFAHVWTIEDGRVRRLEGIIDTATVRRAFEPA